MDSTGADGTHSFWELSPDFQLIAASAIILGLGWKLIAILTGWVKKDPKNENRMKILNFIEQNPGSTVNMIEQDLGIKRGTVRYHVNTLKDTGKILMFRNGNYVSLFRNESAIWNKSHSRTIEPHLQGVTCKNVCRLIYENPGITNKEISEILGLSKSAVASHIRTLEDMGCLIIQASGKFKNYYMAEEHHPDALPFFEKVS
ncbi:MAG: winged helix-turn-helix transcriptional regulator [Methanolobus sp.]